MRHRQTAGRTGESRAYRPAGPWNLTLAAFLLICSIFSTAALAQSSEAISTPRQTTLAPTELGLQGHWINFIAWQQGGEQAFYSVDALSSRILAHNLEGNQPFQATTGRWSLGKPSILRALPAGGYLLQDENTGELIRLDADLRPVRRFKVLVEGDPGRLDALYNWVTDGVTIVAYADVRTAPERWISAIVSFPLENPAAFQIRYSLQKGNNALALYRLGLTFMAIQDGQGYLLALDRTPAALLTFDLDTEAPPRPFGVGSTELAGDLAEGFSLPQARGASSARLLYGALEQGTGAIGLLAAPDGFVYLLLRRPVTEGDGQVAAWEITVRRFDPVSEAVQGSVVIRTKASHLVIEPGVDRWLFLAKGPVEGVGLQEIQGVASIDAAWFHQ